MAETELHAFVMENGLTDLMRKLENIDNEQLFQELDDTIQMDILGASNEEWILMRSKKIVYLAICRELQSRVK